MPSAPRILTNVALGVAAYAVLLGVLLTPPLQRFALYAHKFNTLFWKDVHDGEAFGFARNQVTPFTLRTPDGETLYAWHVLPLDQYAKHEREVRDETRAVDGPVDDFANTTAFRLLQSSQPLPARVVVSFHGNAGHVAQGWRPDTARYMTSRPNTHLFTIDYRGFGHSTGSPSEAGLIIDGVTLIRWVMQVANVPPERIVILGQSLGTAVASAAVLHFADPTSNLLSPAIRELQPSTETEPVTFKGVVLAAPFSSVPALLLTYRIGGLIPLLLPLRPVPFIARMLTAQIIDKWPTGERLAAYYRGLKGGSKLQEGSHDMTSLQLIHAIDDADIPYHQTEIICRQILSHRSADDILDGVERKLNGCIDGVGVASVLDVKEDGLPRLRFELVSHGGHNKIITYTPLAVAVTRAFDDLFE